MGRYEYIDRFVDFVLYPFYSNASTYLPRFPNQASINFFGASACSCQDLNYFSGDDALYHYRRCYYSSAEGDRMATILSPRQNSPSQIWLRC